MYTSQLFENSSQVVAWLRKISKSMINSEGEKLPLTGYVRVTMPQEVIDTLLYGGAQERGTAKQRVYNFVRDGKSYTLKVGISHSKNKDCVFTWDHREGNLNPAS